LVQTDNRKAEWRIVVTEYLITFFKTLRSLEPDRPGVSDGIAYDEGSLYALVGMGDVRVRVPVQEFDPDPAKAAELAINQWKAVTPDEQEMAMEEVKS
jgi:hypothetical protein